MGPQQDDPQAMNRDLLLVGTVGASLLNGMHFSPFFEPALVLFRPVLSSFYLNSQIVSLYLTSIFLGLLTLILAGIPAAIFERFTGRKQSDIKSLSIWLVATLLLVLPSLANAFKGG